MQENDGNDGHEDIGIEENEGVTESEEVLSDKIRISLNVLQKEGIMIEQYHSLLSTMLSRNIDQSRASELPMFYECWTTLLEITDFLEFSKLVKFFGTPYESELNKLKDAIGRYLSKKATMNDLTQAYTILRQLIALSGYQKDTYTQRNLPLDIDL